MLVVVGPFHNVALAHCHPCFYASFILCDTSCFKKKEMPEIIRHLHIYKIYNLTFLSPSRILDKCTVE
jgi:hypothetical protein